MASPPEDEPDPMQYSPEQQRFALNMMANVVGLIQKPQEELEELFLGTVKLHLTEMAGDYELAWGPKVYKESPGRETAPTNAWFVATSKSQKSSVLAIAGTAATSIMGWLQDFNVAHVIDWREWVKTWSSEKGVTTVPRPSTPKNASIAYLASGTAQGTANILRYKSTKASSGTYVYEYLQSLPTDYTIYVTGHSMGGALSPVVGLGLVQSGLVGERKVIALPSAGASPGNTSFKKLWESTFKQSGSGFATNNANFYNTQDMVPHAWCTDESQDRNIYYLNTLFKGQPPRTQTAIILKYAIATVARRSKKSGIDYVGLPGAAFTSDIAINIPANSIFDVFRVQHVDAYAREVKVKRFVDKYKKIMEGSDGDCYAWPADEETTELETLAEQRIATQDD